MGTIIAKCPGCDAEDVVGCDNCGADDKFTLDEAGARCHCETVVTVFDCDCGAEVRPKFFRVATPAEVENANERPAHETGARGIVNTVGSVIFGGLAIIAVAHFGLGIGKSDPADDGKAVGDEVEKILDGLSSDVGSEFEAATNAFVLAVETDKEKIDSENIEGTLVNGSFQSPLFQKIQSLAKSGDVEAMKEAKRSTDEVCARYSGHGPLVLCTAVETTMSALLGNY